MQETEELLEWDLMPKFTGLPLAGGRDSSATVTEETVE